MNETGLIDRKRTEKLFNKRNNQDKKDEQIKIEVGPDGDLKMKIRTIPVVTQVMHTE
jgi:hypothetical protein